MNVLDLQSTLKAIEQALIAHPEIEVIDWSLTDPYVSGTSVYDGIIMDRHKTIEFHYSVFHKIFPYIFDNYATDKFEKASWTALIAICLLKGFNIKLRTSNNIFTVTELASGHYLSLLFEDNSQGKNQFQKIVAYDEIGCYTYTYSNYEDLLNRFLLPILDNEANEMFGIYFKSIDDLNDNNLLMLSALNF